eukprot:TRINITY_DN24737_c0_g1_i1.p1 TRINITY_DN24737_c0_g1~~TRINITY_DN24737_c0_g1_i1.p1  ORF type:complete len:309 (-),score=49.66 TRINITY_DN24737_c0_g1_i1:184-1110(-)
MHIDFEDSSGFNRAEDLLDAATGLLRSRGDASPNLLVVAQRMVEGCVTLFKEAVPHLLELEGVSEGLDRIECIRGQISGEEWMAPYEICFEANGAGGMLTVPDFSHFGPEHLRLTEESMGRRCDVLMRDALHWCCLVPCHEVVHLFQHLAGQADSNAHSWSAEHDASIANAVLFSAVAKLPELADLLPSSLVWEILMVDFHSQTSHIKSWDQSTIQQYSRWIGSFGLVAPDSSISENSVVTEQFKGVSPYEYWSDQPEDCNALLQQLFTPGRTGDVYQHPIECSNQPREMLEVHARPVGEDEWAGFAI